MAKIYPFRALRPRDELAARIASVPYDVVNRQEARKLAEGNEQSFLHVTKPEIDLADSVDPYSDEVYAQGRKALDAFVEAGWLQQDAQPCLYIYALTMAGRTQTGIVLGASVAEYERNFVRKHEFTRPDKENDRVRHMESLNAQSGTVFLTHRDSEAIDGEVQKITAEQPVVDFVAEDDIRHQLWVVSEQAPIAAIQAGFEALGPIYIADGHHRSAAAARVAAARRQAGTEGDAHEKFLAVSFPVSQMAILPYNRVVKDLCGRSAEAFLAAVADRFDVTPGKPEPITAKQFGMFLAGSWHTLTARPGSWKPDDPVDALDVSVLQNQLLEPLLDIHDPRRDKRIDFVGGIRGDDELERRVNDGWAVAFKMHPTALEELLAIADAEAVMPPKSTWFEPKLRDGLFVHLL